jgi:hypothetical protein
MLLEHVSHQWYFRSYGFLYDGRWSYAKVCPKLPMFWEWKYIEYVLKYFLWKAANLSCTFDKRELLLFEEFEVVRKNNCHPIIILGHYSYDLTLAMPFEIFLF